MITSQQVCSIKTLREQARQQDTEALQLKRRAWLDKLSAWNTDPYIKVLEMYPQPNDDPIKSKIESYQFFNPNHNTRTKTNSETCLEIDKLPFEQTIPIICEICSALIRLNFHFAVFYSEGGRSPHIRIYDFEELRDLNAFQRVKAQVVFWRKIVPFGLFHYVDTGVFDDEHFLCLEFAPHWKHHNPFNLLFEWIPEQPRIIKRPEPKAKTTIKKVYKKTESKKEYCKIHSYIPLYETMNGEKKCGVCNLGGSNAVYG